MTKLNRNICSGFLLSSSGYCDDSDICYARTIAAYVWTSIKDTYNTAYEFWSDDENYVQIDSSMRFAGYSVRAVY